MKIEKIKMVKTPVRGTGASAGIDFFVPKNFGVMVNPQESALIPTGIKAEVPKGFMLMAANKSGVCTRTGLIVGATIVDEDYQGEIHMHLINTSDSPVEIESGDKLVQFILVPVSYENVEVVDRVHKTVSERGAGGFGSTGNK